MKDLRSYRGSIPSEVPGMIRDLLADGSLNYADLLRGCSRNKFTRFDSYFKRIKSSQFRVDGCGLITRVLWRFSRGLFLRFPSEEEWPLSILKTVLNALSQASIRDLALAYRAQLRDSFFCLTFVFVTVLNFVFLF